MRENEIVWGKVWRAASRAAWGLVAPVIMGLVLVAPSTRANAQATTATLVGTVTDTTGATLGHQTNDSGNYEFTLLPRCVFGAGGRPGFRDHGDEWACRLR